jgi:hypothetical protein
MQRLAGLTILVLGALIVFQFVALRRMRVEIAQLRSQARSIDLDARRDEIARTGQWLHAWLQSADAGPRAGGLCPNGSPDLDTIRTSIFGVYVQSRAAGASEADARAAVIGHLR